MAATSRMSTFLSCGYAVFDMKSLSRRVRRSVRINQAIVGIAMLRSLADRFFASWQRPHSTTIFQIPTLRDTIIMVNDRDISGVLRAIVWVIP